MSESEQQPLSEELVRFIRENPDHPVHQAIRVPAGSVSPEHDARQQQWLDGLLQRQMERREAAQHIPEDQIEPRLNTDSFRLLQTRLLQLKHQGWKGIEAGRVYSPDDLLWVAGQIPQLAEENRQNAYTDEQLSIRLAAMGVTRTMGFRQSVQRCIQRYFLYATAR